MVHLFYHTQEDTTLYSGGSPKATESCSTQNVYYKTICGAAATCTGLLPLQFRKALHFQEAKGVLFITGSMGKR